MSSEADKPWPRIETPLSGHVSQSMMRMVLVDHPDGGFVIRPPDGLSRSQKWVIGSLLAFLSVLLILAAVFFSGPGLVWIIPPIVIAALGIVIAPVLRLQGAQAKGPVLILHKNSGQVEFPRAELTLHRDDIVSLSLVSGSFVYKGGGETMYIDARQLFVEFTDGDATERRLVCDAAQLPPQVRTAIAQAFDKPMHELSCRGMSPTPVSEVSAGFE